jgi:magnesium chelatase family protein
MQRAYEWLNTPHQGILFFLYLQQVDLGMFAKVYTAQAALTRATIISVEVDLSKGLHSFSIVGLPDKAVEESKDRIGAAIKNAGFSSPKSKNQKLVISLAPADLKKEGPSFDVPMALAYLRATEDIRFNPEKRLISRRIIT